MAARDELLWTIEDLGNAAFAVLASDGPVQDNGQVRDIPDRRTIRYYTTLGLLDRPAAMRGRTALYGRRHLEQLVAIKRLQAEGLTLAEVQARLASTTPKELRSIARVPEEVSVAPVAATPVAEEEIPRSRRAFWSEVPDATAVSESAQESSPNHALYTGVPLAPGATLIFLPTRSLDQEDIRAIERAAEPLLRILRARTLLAEQGEEQ